MLDLKGENEDPRDVLSAIDQALHKREDLFGEINYIIGATFPVIKVVCTEAYHYKKLDITVKDGRHYGIKCVELVNEYIGEYEGILRPLVYILKHLLNRANLNDPYKGGLSSYSLILMLVSLLQWNIYFTKKSIENIRNNLGQMLLQFLSTYGNEFDP